MSAELQMSSTADEAEFPYRAMSSTAIASLVFAIMAALMGFFFWPGLGLAVIGISVGVMALSKINPYKWGFGPFCPEVYRMPSWYCYRCHFGLEYPVSPRFRIYSVAKYEVTSDLQWGHVRAGWQIMTGPNAPGEER